MIYRLGVPGEIDGVQEVRILEWHGAPGHAFAVGDMIVELETHKVVIEVRADQVAVMRQIIIDEGGWTGLGSSIALFSDTDDEALGAETEGLNDCLVTLAVA
ncbi:MAG: biotin/lipoyl-containing protein [Acetobacteraceae bacterium]